AVDVLQESARIEVDPAAFSIPRQLEFPTDGDRTAFAHVYPPTNPAFRAAEQERPPLIVISHGGPTSESTPTFSLQTQFWTSRGFAVVDVNYGGSTGYGRAYRQRLNGTWGVLDTADCINAARPLPGGSRTVPGEEPHQLRRRPANADARPAGSRGCGGPAGAGGADRRGAQAEAPPLRLPAVRGRAARVPEGGLDHPGARGRTLLLRAYPLF